MSPLCALLSASERIAPGGLLRLRGGDIPVPREMFRLRVSHPSKLRGGGGGHSNAKGDVPVEGEPPIQTPEAVGSELGEPSYQAANVPAELGTALSSQSCDPLHGSDPVDLVLEKPDGQPMAPEPGLCASVDRATGSPVKEGPSLIAQSRAALHGSEAEDLVPLKPDGTNFSDNMHVVIDPSGQRRDALRATGAVEAVSSEESGILCEAKRRAPERVGAHLGEDYDFSPLARPVEQPSRHNASSAHQQAPPSMPHQSHAMTSCLGPAEDLGDAALLAEGVRDTPPDRPSASEAPSSVVTAKARTRASQRVEPEHDVKLAPPVHVAKQREHPRREVSPAPSNSDAETVCAPYPDAQLDYDVNQDARSGPVRDPRGPCPDEFEAGAPNNASHASGAIPESISHTPCGSAKYTRLTVHSQPEAHAGANSVFSPHHVSRAREPVAPSSSAKTPAVSGKFVQCVPAGAMGDETRPVRRRVFLGPAVVRDVPRKVPPPEEQRVVPFEFATCLYWPWLHSPKG